MSRRAAPLAAAVRLLAERGCPALTTEIVHVPGEEGAPIRRAPQDYVNEWTVLLVAGRDDLSPADVEALDRSATPPTGGEH